MSVVIHTNRRARNWIDARTLEMIDRRTAVTRLLIAERLWWAALALARRASELRRYGLGREPIVAQPGWCDLLVDVREKSEACTRHGTRQYVRRVGVSAALYDAALA